MCIHIAFAHRQGWYRIALRRSAAGPSSAASVQVAVVRMVQQLSQVYSKLHMSTLEGMVPFYSIHQTEKVIVEAIRHNFLHVSCPCRCKGNREEHVRLMQLEPSVAA